MTTDLRVYPLRLTKRKWRIPIHVHHTCSERCARRFIKDTDDPYRYILMRNPDYVDGKCSRHDKIENGAVRISSFDPDNPRGTVGDLYNPDEVVIPDQKINIDIDYPLTNCVNVTIDFGHPRITRCELLFMISTLYRQIYEEEERTSPPIEYIVSTTCESCEDKRFSDYITTFTPPQKEECSICYSDYKEKEGCKLPCDHVFHEECATRWLEQDEDTNNCPLCRRTVLACNECDGKRITHEYHESVVIPLEHRGMVLNRNRTRGIFGIYGHDLDDLGIEKFDYDRVNKKLHLYIYT